jgi:hypothetical protein
MSRLKAPPPVEFHEADGRLPGFAQRRLESLIEKKKSKRLTHDEERELEEMLDYIDRKNLDILRRRVVLKGTRKKKSQSS